MFSIWDLERWFNQRIRVKIGIVVAVTVLTAVNFNNGGGERDGLIGELGSKRGYVSQLFSTTVVIFNDEGGEFNHWFSESIRRFERVLGVMVKF